MKKLKLIWSVLKERDWLEEMARQGYLLKNITMGIWYEFEEIDPCEKVYEIEHFALENIGEARKEELTLKRNALDVAKQMGWKLVTHDEAMNYYFVKDKAGDETDEFYDDEASRRTKAERCRKMIAIDMPKQLLSLLIFITVIYGILFFVCRNDVKALILWGGIYIAVAVFEVAISVVGIYAGERLYNDLILSRAEWEEKKKYSEKKSFKSAKKLLSYLNDKNAQGLEFAQYKNGTYQFVPTKESYEYYLDTRKALSRRCKEKGVNIIKDKKDIENRGISWQEQSMVEAEKLDLEVVGMVEYGTVIYRRNSKKAKVTWDTMVVNTGYGDTKKTWITAYIVLFVIAFMFGVILAIV